MAKGFKSGGKDFKKGWKGGPGQPKIPELVKEAQKLNREEFIAIANRYLEMTKDELKERIGSPATPMKELMVASIIHRSVLDGDQHRYEFLLDRLIGKVVQKIESENTHRFEVPEEIKRLNDAELIIEARRLLLCDLNDPIDKSKMSR